MIISYLPLAHIYEQFSFIHSLERGMAIGFYSGDPARLLEDMQVLKPTVFFTVPRILNRVQAKILERAEALVGEDRELY